MSKRRSSPVIPPKAGDKPLQLDARHRAQDTRSRPHGRRRVGAALVVMAALGAGFFAATRRAHPPARPTVPTAAPVLALPPAEQALRSTLSRIPGDPDAHRALARYLLDQRRAFEALWHFQAALELDPADSGTSIAVARAVGKAGLPHRARFLLRARLAAAPTDLETRQTLAESFLATAQPREALAALESAGSAVASSAPAQLLRGDIRAALGDAAGARAAYRRATGLEPEGAVGYDRLGRLALTAGDWATARSAFEAAREREPGEPAYGYRLGEAYAGAGETNEAERLWAEVADAAPGYASARLALGQAFRRRKQWHAAASHLVAAVQADSASEEAQFALAEVMTAQGDAASSYYQRGFFCLHTDRPHLAVAEFRRMERVAPDRVDGPLMISLAYIQMKRLDLAASAAQRGLERHPHDPRLLGRLGLLHVLGRNRPLAKRLCEEWLKTAPGAAEPYRLLGLVARDELRLPESLRYYEQALARDPKSAVACFEMSKTLTGLPGPENSRRALDLARQAAALNPQEADYWHRLGVLLQGAGRREEAAGAFLRALDRSPDSVGSCSALVQVAAQEGQRDASRFFASLVPDLEERRRTGNPLWRAVYRHPNDAVAHARLARFLLATGDLRRARYQLQQVTTLRPTDRAAQQDLSTLQRLLALQAR